MALAAGHADVRPSERELGGSVVIELGILPLRSVMTHCAILGKSRCQVVGVLGAVVVGQVTGYARRCNAFESAIAVALCADWIGGIVSEAVVADVAVIRQVYHGRCECSACVLVTV